MKRRMTPQQLTDELRTVCGTHLRAVILYGSAATGDHVGGRSDYNVLVVLDRVDLDALDALAPLVRRWVKAGHPAPLLWTPDGLAAAADSFPLEIADIKAGHVVLFGEDVVRDLPVHAAHLRLELEHELRGKLLALRQQYLLAQGRPRDVTALMTRSLSTFLVLCRGALRLYQQDVPLNKMDALAALAGHIRISTETFAAVHALKTGRGTTGVPPATLFAQYLQAVESFVDAVDVQLRATGKEERP